MPGCPSGLGNGADRDEKETGAVHGRWGRDSGNAGTDAGEDERQVWAWRCREISRATAATSPNQATCSLSSTFSAKRPDGQGDRRDRPAQRGTEEGGKLRARRRHAGGGRRHGHLGQRSCCRGRAGCALVERRGSGHSSGQDDEEPGGSSGGGRDHRGDERQAAGQGGAWVGLRRDSRPAEPDRNQRSLAHREQLHADGLRAIHRDSCHCSSDFSGDSTRFRAASSGPDADDEHHQEREQLFGGAAFAIFAGVDVAGRSAGARATGWPGDSSPADRATFSDAGHADYRRLRQQSGADTAVSETTR